MVISHILGGIGNQMFQYAAGRALSQKTSQLHLVDLSGFSTYKLHNGYELNRVFNVDVESADTKKINQLLGWKSNKFAMKVLRRRQFSWLRGEEFVVEPSLDYWPGLWDRKNNSYLFGYWQSELYFQKFEGIIRQDFSFRQPLIGKNLVLANEIENTSSISLHVRRGDYISDSATRSIMDVCSIDYYRKAIKYIVEQVEAPVFFIFSDDIAWVKKELDIKFPCTFVEHNRTEESYIDMQLMSLCRHNIIANSSFSWWGAWLNSNSQKIVVAPKRWFRREDKELSIVSKQWVRL